MDEEEKCYYLPLKALRKGFHKMKQCLICHWRSRHVADYFSETCIPQTTVYSIFKRPERSAHFFPILQHIIGPLRMSSPAIQLKNKSAVARIKYKHLVHANDRQIPVLSLLLGTICPDILMFNKHDKELTVFKQ